MIAVKMADKNALKLTGMKRGIKHLMLCPFAAIKSHTPGCVGCCRCNKIAVTLRERVGTPADVPKN